MYLLHSGFSIPYSTFFRREADNAKLRRITVTRQVENLPYETAMPVSQTPPALPIIQAGCTIYTTLAACLPIILNWPLDFHLTRGNNRA